MTPEQWRRLPPNQQAAHVARYGPPPAHWGSIPYAYLPTATLPRTSPRRWPWIVAVVVVLMIVGIVSLGRGASTTGTTTAAPTTAHLTPAASQAAVDAPAAAPAQVKLGPAKVITARDWAKIAKDPDAHTGETVVVYGQVQQFDAATGNDTFRANVDGVVHKPSFGYVDYETNTVLTGQGADLGDLVQDDLFKADVVVAGSLSYDTTLGGATTVPHLLVTKITVTGSAK